MTPVDRERTSTMRAVTRWSSGVLAVGLALTLLTVPSGADTTWVTDRDDTKGFLDVKAIAHGHGRGGRLKHTVTTFAKWRSKDLWCGAVAMEFPGLDRELIVFYRKKLRAIVVNERTGEGIGNPRVTRPTRRRVAVAFPRRWLRPGLDEYRWFVRTVRRGSDCPARDGDKSVVVRDRAPRRGRSILHRL